MTLFLFPNLLDESLSHEGVFSPSMVSAVSSIDGLIAESEKGARLFLRRFSFPSKTFRDIPLRLLNEHSKKEEIKDLLEPLLRGERWGLVSDCGLPCFADPGAALVQLAREKGISVQAFFGPSSIVLALMLSGLPAQAFSFQGYLERDGALLKAQIHKLDKRSREEKSVQMCIEAPYRSKKLLMQLLEGLSPETQLCVACDLMLPSQKVETKPVSAWRKSEMWDVEKRPCVFLFLS